MIVTPVTSPLDMDFEDRNTTQTKLAALLQPIYQQAQAKADAARNESLMRLRSNQAARGILRSGISEYGSGQVENARNLSLGETGASLASILGQTEGNRSLDYSRAYLGELATKRDHERSLDLARQIAAMNKKKKNKLGSILGGATSGAQLGGSVGGPYGAFFGAVGGGLLGAYGDEEE